ncbi:MAG: UPF0179 family protein [Candidatus Odinarchaeia archaeon]
MKKITIIGKPQAKIGHKFIFNTKLPDCEKCKLKQVCEDNLELGRVYEITAIRDKEHYCEEFQEEVVVVEVNIPQIIALIESKKAFEGVTLTFTPIEQGDVPKELQKYINPPGLKPGDKCKVIKIMKKPKGKKSRYVIAQLELVINDSLG